MSAYHQIIREATGFEDHQTLERIEDCMRDIIYHSTLDWQSRDELEQGAREAVDVLCAMGEIERRLIEVRTDELGCRITNDATGEHEAILMECPAGLVL